MGEIKATPRNRFLGLLADGLQSAQDFASQPFGYNNPPAQALLGLFGVPAVTNTINELSYGGALGTGSGMTWKPKADTMDALMVAAPLTATAGKAAIEKAPAAVARMAENAMVPRTLSPQAGALRIGDKKFVYPQEQALLTAQKNAASTPAERMLQQGYEDGWYHGSTGDIRRFDNGLLGEATGAQSAKKAHFFARDPQNPPAHMTVKAEPNSDSVQMLRKLGIPEEKIAELNTVSMKGHGAETASGYAKIGGSREYREAMRKSAAAEKSGNWDEYEKWMQIAEDAEIGRNQELQSLVAKYGDARDTMLDKVNSAIYSKQLPQNEAEALDKQVKQLMPYGWYNSYSIPQMQGLKTHIASMSDNPQAALKAIDDFISVKAERQLAEHTQEGGNVMPVALRYKNPLVHDFGGSAYRDQSYSDLLDKAIAGGHDAVLMKNTFDPGAGPAKLVDIAAIFNPNQIRSKFAAFDPARMNDSDILGKASPGLLGLLAGGTGAGVAGYNWLTDR